MPVKNALDRGICKTVADFTSKNDVLCLCGILYRTLTTAVREFFLLIITQWMSQSYSINFRYTVERSAEGLSSM